MSRDLQLAGDVMEPGVLSAVELDALPRADQTSDFHCVTTWSYVGARWSGYRFADVYARYIEGRLNEARLDGSGRDCVILLRCRDGYRT
ncbi:MAG: hypothetical protein HKN12_03510, partial [Gemmatimonadetes bacterium]|nr:hypothetical protein [Gemmatimonadota bacterium]